MLCHIPKLQDSYQCTHIQRHMYPCFNASIFVHQIVPQNCQVWATFFQVAQAMQEEKKNSSLMPSDSALPDAVKAAGAHPIQVLLDIRNPEALACTSNHLLNKQGWTSTSYPSQIPDTENNNPLSWPTLCFACTGSNPYITAPTRSLKHITFQMWFISQKSLLQDRKI